MVQLVGAPFLSTYFSFATHRACTRARRLSMFYFYPTNLGPLVFYYCFLKKNGLIGTSAPSVNETGVLLAVQVPWNVCLTVRLYTVRLITILTKAKNWIIKELRTAVKLGLLGIRIVPLRRVRHLRHHSHGRHEANHTIYVCIYSILLSRDVRASHCFSQWPGQASLIYGREISLECSSSFHILLIHTQGQLSS